MSNTYEHVIPAALGTLALIQHASGERFHDYPVVAWASVNGGPLEALVDLNDTGELTPVSEIRATSTSVTIDHPSPIQFGS